MDSLIMTDKIDPKDPKDRKEQQEDSLEDTALDVNSPSQEARKNLVDLRAQKRKESLAKALRENLLKRKMQQRQRSALETDKVGDQD